MLFVVLEAAVKYVFVFFSQALKMTVLTENEINKRVLSDLHSTVNALFTKGRFGH